MALPDSRGKSVSFGWLAAALFSAVTAMGAGVTYNFSHRIEAAEELSRKHAERISSVEKASEMEREDIAEIKRIVQELYRMHVKAAFAGADGVARVSQ